MEVNVEKLIQAQIEDMDLTGMARQTIRELISPDVSDAIREIINTLAKSMIADEISRVLNGPVETDDGWGSKTSYPSFEDMFKKAFMVAMKDTYAVKREIETQVKNRVDSLVSQRYQEVITKVVDSISNTVLVPKK